MRRLLGLALLLAASAGAQFVEIRADASASEGKIEPLFGIDAPEDARQAKLLLERGFEGPVRLGPRAALRTELEAALPEPWMDEQREDSGRSEVAIWSGDAAREPIGEAAGAVAAAIALQGGAVRAAYYRRSSGAWFDGDGEPFPALVALELGSRLGESPRRVGLEFGDESLSGLAGTSSDGETLRILLARRPAREGEAAQAASFVLYVENLPWGAADFRTERYRVDAEHDGELVHEGAGRGGMARLTALFAAPAVELIVLRKADAIPGAGVIRRRSRPTN
jgi:hypothetical protein